MNFTKLFSLILAMILVLGVVAIPVSATVPYGSEKYYYETAEDEEEGGIPVWLIIAGVGIVALALIPIAIIAVIVVIVVVVVKKNKAKNAVVSKEETVSVAENNSEEIK